MPYSAAINRQNPTCFLFLIDQSGSMDDADANGQKKCVVVADMLNRLLQELTLMCAKDDGIRDYFHVGVIGYGEKVGPVLSGALAGRELVPIGDVALLPTRIEERQKLVPDGAGGVLTLPSKFPVWVDPVAQGGTPMGGALRMATTILRGWLEHHPKSYPPLVVNLTDGEATDGNPVAAARAVQAVEGNDGRALLFNGHISARKQAPATFPDRPDALPDAFAKTLFEMSSVLPPMMQQYAATLGYPVSDGSRGFVFNGDLVPLAHLLEIGTKATRVLLR